MPDALDFVKGLTSQAGNSGSTEEAAKAAEAKRVTEAAAKKALNEYNERVAQSQAADIRNNASDDNIIRDGVLTNEEKSPASWHVVRGEGNSILARNSNSSRVFEGTREDFNKLLKGKLIRT